jgi:hypothetical protein
MERNMWVKATGCESNTCVEVMAHEHTDRCDSGKCVEVFASDPTIGMVYVNKNTFTVNEWRVFVDGVRAGEFDV